MKVYPKDLAEAEGDSWKERVQDIVSKRLETKIGKEFFGIVGGSIQPAEGNVDFFVVNERERVNAMKKYEFLDKPLIADFIYLKDGVLTRKMCSFTARDILGAWKEQHDWVESIDDFFKIYIDDFGEAVDLDPGDEPRLIVEKRGELKACLLEEFPDDFEKLGFQKSKDEKKETQA